jgi:hypothetical protein
VWTDFDKCHNLSKQNVKLILKILSDLEPLKGLVEQKNVFNSFLCKLGFFWHKRANIYFVLYFVTGLNLLIIINFVAFEVGY